MNSVEYKYEIIGNTLWFYENGRLMFKYFTVFREITQEDCLITHALMVGLLRIRDGHAKKL